jgi:hypothetical protein
MNFIYYRWVFLGLLIMSVKVQAEPFLPAAQAWNNVAVIYDEVIAAAALEKQTEEVARAIEFESFRGTANWRELETQRVAAWKEHEAALGRLSGAEHRALELVFIAKEAGDPDTGDSPEERAIRKISELAESEVWKSGGGGREVAAIAARTYANEYGRLALRNGEIPFGTWREHFPYLPRDVRLAIFETFLVRARNFSALVARDVLNLAISFYLTTYARENSHS